MSDGYGGWCLELRRGGRYMGKTKQKINVRYSAEKHMDPPLNLSVAYLRTMLTAFYSRGAARGLKTRGVKWMFRMKVPDSKNLGQSLVMLSGPSWAPKFIALLETKFGAHQGKNMFALTLP